MVTSVETARLHLRPWHEDDFPELVRLYSDPEVMRYISRGQPLTQDRVRGILDKQLRHWREHGFGPWIAEDKATGAWLGELGLNELPDWPDADKIEVGWELFPSWWGRGLATEGARAALRFGFRDHHLARIISVTIPDNVPSRRVMDKIGLLCQGTRRWRNAEVVWYALDRASWETGSSNEGDYVGDRSTM